MSLKNTRTTIDGPAGALEIAIDCPAAPRAVALVCHPNPQQGGTMDNKVVTTLAKAFGELNFAVARFNYRGVGKSEGVWDDGIGETLDALAALAALRNTCGADLPVLLSGFSFGAFIAAAVSSKTAPQVAPEKILLVGPAIRRFSFPLAEEKCVVIHGEEDEVVPLADVMNWVRPHKIPVTVFSGTTHFFHGQLIPLRNTVKALCQF